jgi:formate hydrogenlyase transcriptional activator
VDVRVIAVTNRDLTKMVSQGGFRRDLYYRLSTFPITIPPLRDHHEDVGSLVSAFAKEFGARMGKTIDTMPQKAIEALQSYAWPGNIRELRNAVERAVILSRGPNLWVPVPDGAEARTPRGTTLDEVQRQHIINVLTQTGWRVRGKNGAAAVLGMNESTLRSKMNKLGIRRPG